MFLKGISSSRYYIFAVSNFLAALGGGLLLGKASNVIVSPSYLHGGSLLAFFIGTILLDFG